MIHDEFVARCVWCNRPLRESPTQRYWVRHMKHGMGICYECVIRLAHGVLIGMETEWKGEEGHD